MKRWAPGPIAALVVAVLSVSVVVAAPGDHISPADFDLFAGTGSRAANNAPVGIASTDTHLYVIQQGMHRSGSRNSYLNLHAYLKSDGTYDSAAFEGYNTGGTVSGYSGFTFDGSWFRMVKSGSSNGSVISRDGWPADDAPNNFSLAPANDHPSGITWDGAFLRVVDYSDDKVYSYTTDGTYTSSADFDLDSDNGNPTGITWDGTYYRVVDSGDDKVYAYTTSGTYVDNKDFNLNSDNGSPTGITWDGTYYRVVDSSDDKVYTYEGEISSTPTTNYGLADDVEYAAAVSTEVVAYGDWKCIRSPNGETVRINNAELTVHGFCAKPEGDGGIRLELHLHTTAQYAELLRFANVSGTWWFIETGIAAQFDLRIYDDDPATETGRLAFTEEIGGLVTSNRLGFRTMAKVVEDTDCAEESDGAGFVCNRSHLSSLSATDRAILLFSLTNENKVEFADAPLLPESVTVTRNSGYTPRP